MSEQVFIRKINEVYFKISTELSILHEIQDAFEFEVPNAKYHPKVKMGVWDGRISMVNRDGNMYVGLYHLLSKFCERNGYELIDEPNEAGEVVNHNEGLNPKEIIEFVESLNLHSDGEPLEPRDYQLAAIYAGCNRRRATLLSATSSGKSMMIYCIIRFILDIDPDAHILLMVPTTALVYQMRSDFIDYSSHNGFDVEGLTQVILEGESKKVTHNIVISTWQSVYKETGRYFNQFTAIFCDEVHTAQAASIRGIMEKATQVKYRIGLTGSLNKTKTHEYVIQGLFGRIYIIAKTRDLIDRGYVSDIKIKCVTFLYTDKEEISLMKKADYATEMFFLTTHAKRNSAIARLAVACQKNTLVLFNFQEHGDELYRLIKERAGDRKVFLIHGKARNEDGKLIKAKEKDAIRKIIEQEEDAIIVASYKMFSTGINIKRLFNVIAASPTKSLITILQSIGRGLRKAKGKTHFNWFDISDLIWETKTRNNTTFNHFAARLEIYTEEGFEYTITEMKL